MGRRLGSGKSKEYYIGEEIFDLLVGNSKEFLEGEVSKIKIALRISNLNKNYEEKRSFKYNKIDIPDNPNNPETTYSKGLSIKRVK